MNELNEGDRRILDDLVYGSLDKTLNSSLSRIDLYGARTGNCLRVSVAFEEAEIPYSVKKVDLTRNEQRSPAHLSRNPNGKVPTIVEHFRNGRVLALSQSNAILMYAAQKNPHRLLLPSDNGGRALALERFFYFVTDVIAVSHAAFRTKDKSGDSAFLDAQSLAALAFAESFLRDSSFMAGEALTLADISAFTIVSAYQLRLEWDQLPEMRRWFDAMSTRPAVKRGMCAFD
jgi:GSH-dependent disulfide-bond oxidoreductase